ncbi:MAG: hypothetical protein K0U98_24105 [Deltaproteobacteria bacterium]|nr:hypothetical protein [Deltaproteobacteria bacterium]
MSYHQSAWKNVVSSKQEGVDTDAQVQSSISVAQSGWRRWTFHPSLHRVLLCLEIILLLIPALLITTVGTTILLLLIRLGGGIGTGAGQTSRVEAIQYLVMVLVPFLLILAEFLAVKMALKNPSRAALPSRPILVCLFASVALGLFLMALALTYRDPGVGHYLLLSEIGPAILMNGLSFLVPPLHLFWLYRKSRFLSRSSQPTSLDDLSLERESNDSPRPA